MWANIAEMSPLLLWSMGISFDVVPLDISLSFFVLLFVVFLETDIFHG